MPTFAALVSPCPCGSLPRRCRGGRGVNSMPGPSKRAVRRPLPSRRYRTATQTGGPGTCSLELRSACGAATRKGAETVRGFATVAFGGPCRERVIRHRPGRAPLGGGGSEGWLHASSGHRPSFNRRRLTFRNLF